MKAAIVPLAVGIAEYNFAMPLATEAELALALDGVADQPVDLLLLPQYIIGKDDPCAAQKAARLAAFAKQKSCYVAVNKYADGACVTEILGRDGAVCGSYVKTHAVEGLDVPLQLGDELPVFELDFGKVAFLAGSDLYFPEAAEIFSLKGAEILLYSLGIEPLRDDTQAHRLLRARAIADYMFVGAATYASSRKMYMTNNYDLCFMPTEEAQENIRTAADFNTNGLGLLPGRSVVYDLRGEPIASSGREAGAALALVDLERKRNITDYIFGPASIIYHQNQRGVFNSLALAHSYRKKAYAVKKPVLSFIHLPYQDTIGLNKLGNGHEQDVNYQKLLACMRQAAEYSDMVITSEYSAPGNAMGQQMYDTYAGIAAENHCYVAVNQEIDKHNISIIWDRYGKEVLRYEKVNGLCFVYDKIDEVGSELPVAELDFATVGVMVCADVYSQEIARVLALKGADLIILQSQSWGYDSAAINEGVARAYCIENAVSIATCTFPSSQVVHRSNIIDPTGETIFSTDYDREGVYPVQADIDATVNHKSFVCQNGTVTPDYELRRRLYQARRPQLYRMLTTLE